MKIRNDSHSKKRFIRSIAVMLLVLVYIFTGTFGAQWASAATKSQKTLSGVTTKADNAADNGTDDPTEAVVPTEQAKVWEKNKIFIKDLNGNYRDFAYIYANPGDEIELYAVLDNVELDEGADVPSPSRFGYWMGYDMALWPTNTWAHAKGEAETTWIVTTTITVTSGMDADVNISKDNVIPTDSLRITARELPSDMEIGKIYVDAAGNGNYVKNTSNSNQHLKVNRGTIAVKALIEGVERVNGTVPDMSQNGSGFWTWNNGSLNQNWTCLSTLRGIWLTESSIYVNSDNSAVELNLAKDGTASIDTAYLRTSNNNEGFFVKTNNGDFIINNPYIPFVMELGTTLDVYASFTGDFSGWYSITLSNPDVLEMEAGWNQTGNIWSATLTAKQLGQCELTKSIFGMTGPEIIIKVLEKAPAYDTDKIYTKLASDNKFEDRESVKVTVGEEFELLTLVQSPNLQNGMPDTAAYVGSGYWTFDNIGVYDVQWTEYLNDQWLLTAKCVANDGGRFELGFAKNGVATVDLLSVLAVHADGMIQVDDIVIGNMVYSEQFDIGINTATRMMTGDYSVNSNTNRYPVYVGEELHLNTRELDADGEYSFNLKGDALKVKEAEPTKDEADEIKTLKALYTAEKPGTCEVELLKDGILVETFYIDVHNPIYVQTSLGAYHKDVVHEYVRTALAGMPDDQPTYVITDPDCTALYVKNNEEYPYEMVVGDTVTLTGKGSMRLTGDVMDIVSMNNGTVELYADAVGTATVTLGGELFYINVVQDAQMDHFDLEILDGGVYSIREISIFSENRTLVTETYYNIEIAEINGCGIYDKEGNEKYHIDAGEYWGRNTVNYKGDTQYEFTSAYVTDGNGRLIDAAGNDIDDAVRAGLMDPVVKQRRIMRSEVETVKFDVVFHLTPYAQSRILHTEAGDIELESNNPTEILNKAYEVELGALDIQDARNKCPSTTGADFAINYLEENIDVFGHLCITKEVEGNDIDQKDKEFTFTVYLSDPADVALGDDKVFNYCYISNDVEGPIAGTIKNGDKITLKHGEMIKIDKLPSGTKYKVVEDSTIGYEVVSEGEIGDIETGQIRYANFTNQYRPGSLSVTKTVAGRGGDTNQEFEFTVTMYDENDKVLKTVDGKYGQMTFSEGVAKFTLKHGDTIQADELPSGAKYVVEEKTVEGYTTVSTGETGTIKFGETKSVVFTNTRDNGGLVVSKTVVGRDKDDSLEFEFTVTMYDKNDKVLKSVDGEYGQMTFKEGVASFKLKSGDNKTAAELPTGAKYVVEEKTPEGYTATFEGETDIITKDKTFTAAFTNERDTGNLSVTKKVEGRDGDTEAEFEFTVTLSDKTITGLYGDMNFEKGVATVYLKSGVTKTAVGLPTGIGYEVEETHAKGYTMSLEGDAEGKIEKDATFALVFTNTRDTGDLSVTKKVEGRDGDTEMEFEFTVTLSDPSINGEYGGMTFKEGVASFKLKDGDTATAEGLPTGITYTVEENPAEGYTAAYENEKNTIEKDEVQGVTITNTRDTGSLVVSKVVMGRDGDTEREFTFTVTLDDESINGTYDEMTFENGVAVITLKDGESKTASGLPTGITYTVEETATLGYTAVYDGDTSTVKKDETAEVTVTNTRDTGNLTVSKTVEGRDGDTEREFTFTVTLNDTTINGEYGDMTFENGVATVTLKHGESVTAEGLPTNVVYTVEEAEAEGYTTTSVGETGSIENGATATVEFTNTRDTGSMSVTKTVAGRGGDENLEFTFTVTLSDTTINGEYGEMTFENGVAAFTLKHGETKTAAELPTGVSYKVEETAAEGYTTVFTGAEGTIEKDETNACVFTNTRDNGNLVVSKTVVGRDGETNREFTFTVTLSDTTINGEYGEMTFTNGVATFTLKHGESKSAEELPTGVTYTVQEAEAEGYTVAFTGETGTIEPGEPKAAAFTNERDTGSLTVSKTVEGRDGDTEREFTFTVTLNDTTINGEYGDMSFKNGVATFTLKHGESKTAKDLPTGVAYTVEESEAEGYTAAYEGETGAIVKDETVVCAVTNTRDTGDLTVSKTVTGADDDETEFIFTVTLSDTMINGEYGDMLFVNGVASFTLKHGESKTAEGLPTGVDYTVEETETEGYELTSKTGETGTITVNEDAKAEFVNHKLSDVPKTGDSSHLIILLSVMAVALLAAIALIVVSARRRNHA